MITIPIRVRPIILLLGDSITEQGFGWEGAAGWASLLASDYSRRADVLNRGFTGYNTRNMLDILPAVQQQQDQEILFATIFLGANDSAPQGDPQHVPIDEFESNLERLIGELRCSSTNSKSVQGKAVPHIQNQSEENVDNTAWQALHDEILPIVLITPPPVDVETWFKERCEPFGDPADRFNDLSRIYGERVKQVGDRMECCSVVDLFAILGGNTNDENLEGFVRPFLRDGVHLSDQGNRILHAQLMENIRRDFPDLAPMVDGDGKHGTSGISLEGALASDLC